jgi:hypothetical protein
MTDESLRVHAFSLRTDRKGCQAVLQRLERSLEQGSDLAGHVQVGFGDLDLDVTAVECLQMTRESSQPLNSVSKSLAA